MTTPTHPDSATEIEPPSEIDTVIEAVEIDTAVAAVPASDGLASVAASEAPIPESAMENTGDGVALAATVTEDTGGDVALATATTENTGDGVALAATVTENTDSNVALAATAEPVVGLSPTCHSGFVPESSVESVASLESGLSAACHSGFVPESSSEPIAPLKSSLPPIDFRSTIERLREWQPVDRAMSWAITALITVMAFAIRLINIDYPKKVLFDETYYAKDGYALWKFGYEYNWAEGANDKIINGTPEAFGDGAEYAVHPPLAKWLIGVGEQIFGMTPLGWRFMSLIFGTLLVFLVIRLARRLSRSTLIGAIAGLLLTFDGLAFVMSRIALLDIFQAVFLVAGVSCVLADRDYYRHRLADKLVALKQPDFGGQFGPIVWLRPWRLAAGLLFGAAIACKWNSMFVLAAMGILSVLWDVGARRLAGASWRSWLALLYDGIPAFIRMVVVAAGVYVASWAGWLLTTGGYMRDWGEKNPTEPLVTALGKTWASWVHLHTEIFSFHVGDYMREQTHPYDSHPLGWLFMIRPTGIDAVNGIKPGTDGCPADATENCIRVISAMGTPLLWWLAAAAVVVGLIWWLGARDWRFGLPVVALAATYLPWFANADRPVFFFYTITIIPFAVISLAMMLGLILGPQNGRHRWRNGVIVGLILGLIVANFAYIYPILSDELLLYSQWYSRMWFPTWI